MIVNLTYVGGLDYTRYNICNTAEWGDLVTGPRIITDETKKEMKRMSTEIQDATFARNFRAEYAGGMKNFKRLYAADSVPIRRLDGTPATTTAVLCLKARLRLLKYCDRVWQLPRNYPNQRR